MAMPKPHARSPRLKASTTIDRSRPPVRHPVARQTLAAATVEAIRDRILSGVYAEGEQLRQDALAADLGVSRIPVREALRQLEAEGLVTFNPHRGAVVSSFSVAEIEELFDIRAMLESDLLRRSIPHLTDEDFHRAAEILDDFEAAFNNRDIAAWGDLNWQLHSTLYAAADRPMTMGVVENLHHRTNRYARMQLALTHGESRAREEHRALVAAARKRNVDRACTLLEAHILGAGRALARFLRGERSEDGQTTARSTRKHA
ncbi:MAG TPA: GntR family transcriptional regulator [Gemmatimonadaceae bacterium]|nr:GntR family transcriptional regulator [Gemmatimonadaceae bacterium]